MGAAHCAGPYRSLGHGQCVSTAVDSVSVLMVSIDADTASVLLVSTDVDTVNVLLVSTAVDTGSVSVQLWGQLWGRSVC